MDGQMSGLSPTAKAVLRYIQQNDDQPPTLSEIASRLRCSPTVAYEIVKTLLQSSCLVVTRDKGTIVYIAQRPG